jgi:hypothetical protein
VEISSARDTFKNGISSSVHSLHKMICEEFRDILAFTIGE